MTLATKTIHGVVWNLVEKLGLQVTRFILAILLARLLTPQDYGLIGMIMVLFAIAQVFVEGGLGSAYIQKKDATDIDANTVFFTNLLISGIMYVLIWNIAPAVSNFYNQPQLVDLTRVMGIIFVINAFGVIQQAKLRRQVNFKAKAIVNLFANLLSGGLAIFAAIKGLGVWSIVIQYISLNILNVIGLWRAVRWKPRFIVSLSALKELFSFGFWILMTGILTTLTDNLYILVIGKLFPSAQVGYYTKAKQFQKMSSEQLSQAISGVAFPVFSKIQDDNRKLKSGMSRLMNFSLILVVPIMVVMNIGAEPIVRLLLTDKWIEIVPYLRLLAVIGALYPIHLVNIQVLISQGRSDLNFKLTIIKNVLRVINIIVMGRYGVLYIIMGEIMVSVIALVINTRFTKQTINYSLFEQLLDIKSILLSIIIAGGFGWFIRTMTGNLWTELIVLFAGTELIFILVQYFTKTQLLVDLRNMIQGTINKP